MASPIVITCPACRKQLKVPAEFAGKKVRCKCGSTLRVGGAPKKPAEPSPKTNPAAPAEQSLYAFKPEESGSAAAAVEQQSGDKPAAERKRFLDDDDDANPYDITVLDDAPRCPYCAKEMPNAEAVICLNCGYNSQTRQMVTTKRVFQTTFGDWCIWLGPGIACLITVIVLLGGDAYWCFGGYFVDNWWDPMDKWAETRSFSNGLRVWVSVMVLFVCWFAAKFAFRRLVLNPRPPEIEKKK